MHSTYAVAGMSQTIDLILNNTRPDGRHRSVAALQIFSISTPSLLRNSEKSGFPPYQSPKREIYKKLDLKTGGYL